VRSGVQSVAIVLQFTGLLLDTLAQNTASCFCTGLYLNTRPPTLYNDRSLIAPFSKAHLSVAFTLERDRRDGCGCKEVRSGGCGGDVSVIIGASAADAIRVYLLVYIIMVAEVLPCVTIETNEGMAVFQSCLQTATGS
jgi:hypothetical protein